MKEPSPTPNHSPHWRRAIRPLLWWFVLVLLMFLYRTHERLMEQTLLRLIVNLEGMPSENESTITMDGQPATIGQKLSLGSHRFEIKHPKAETFSTNVSVWYEGGDLGNVTLKRIRGVMALRIEPLAGRVSVSGQEFSTVLTNSGGVTSSIPTGTYRVEARWANSRQMEQVTISHGETKVVRFAPSLADLTIESDPPGATVYGSGSDIMGRTPLVLRELPAGTWRGELKLEGYLPVPLVIDLKPKETNLVRTNLTNWKHNEALSAARSFFDAGEYDRALDAVDSALQIKPNDPDALKLKRNVNVLKHLRQAESLANNGEYAAARIEAEQALKLMPDQTAVQLFLTQLGMREEAKKQKDAASVEQRKQERLAVPKKAFSASVAANSFDGEGPLFDDFELKTTLPPSEAGTLIHTALQTGMPRDMVGMKELSWPNSFEVSLQQELNGGQRRCVVVGVQTGEKETQIMYKVMEYASKRTVGFDNGLTFNRSFTPLHPSRIGELTDKMKAQIEEGKRVIGEKIRRALGESVVK